MGFSRLIVALMTAAIACVRISQAASDGGFLPTAPANSASSSPRPLPWSFAPLHVSPPSQGSVVQGSEAPSKGILRATHPIDAFIQARLVQEHLSPSAPADPATLLRRLSFDITGLPPTVAELDAFLVAWKEDPALARDTAIDRLLSSPRYGEKMATRWLDLARYADTSGFQGDPYRSMWRWRDYVIDSFNQNKPFDQFTIEQLAGDLLPSPTLEQRIATGFNRNHRFNTEFGSIEEEWRVENVIDRVETTATTWMALTLGCARCHDHKYDPISQREFYQFFAFLGNVDERGVFWDGNEPAFAPRVRAPLSKDLPATEEARREQNLSESRLLSVMNQEEEATAAWESRNRSRWSSALRRWTQAPGRIERSGRFYESFPSNALLHLPFDQGFDAGYGIRERLATNVTRITNQFLHGISSTITRFEVKTQRVDMARTLSLHVPEQAKFNQGPLGKALQLSPGSSTLTISNLLDHDRFTFCFWIRPLEPNGDLLLKMGRQELFPIGYSLTLTQQHLHLEVNHKMFEFDATMVPVELTSKETVPLGTWSHIGLVLDGKRRGRGPTIFLNGRALEIDPLKATARGLNTLSNSAPLLVGGTIRGTTFRGEIDDFWMFDRPLSDGEMMMLSQLPAAFDLATPQHRRSPAMQAAAAGFFGKFLSTNTTAAAGEVATARRQLEKLESSEPWVMVMNERPEAPSARILSRGQYDAPGETVPAGVPASLGRLPAQAPTNRLGLALWLTDPSHPLTSRVLVNRLWESIFGIGLVRTSENFGTQAEPPSHPELLDWLANDLVRHGWDIKRTLRQIFRSSTYAQSSHVDPALLARDPENRLLARAPRVRLSAEEVRDAALRASGLLIDKVGGPSVVPYLPNETPACSEDLYRRSLYTFWQRTRFNPSLAAFDAPTREACVARRPRTNTPLQALALMNEVTYLEASRRLAERMLLLSDDRKVQIQYGIKAALGREPMPDETERLVALFDTALREYEADPMAALRLIRNGVSRPRQDLKPAELAALTLVGSALFNLDEFITKE